MSALIQEMSDKAQRLGVPLAVQFDLTYRCNERCVHCYLPQRSGSCWIRWPRPVSSS
jgi:MoaA/NifB/PqqE/SkfB family radical SAM enzyme